MRRLLRKRALVLGFKLGLSILLLYLIFTRTDTGAIWKHLRTARPFFIIASVILFNMSQIVSAARTKLLLAGPGNRRGSLSFHIRLYYRGMFYNLLIPGGIGGDAYKVLELKNRFNLRTKYLVSLLLADRLSGLYALVMLGSMIELSFAPLGLGDNTWIVILVLFTGSLLYLIIYRMVFRPFYHKFFRLHGLGFLVQFLQGLSFAMLLFSLGHIKQLWSYIEVFYLSSVVSVIPVSFGGVGLRELVFATVSAQNEFDTGLALAASLIFTAITIISSLPGIWIGTGNTREIS